jgi:hypothetical protein
VGRRDGDAVGAHIPQTVPGKRFFSFIMQSFIKKNIEKIRVSNKNSWTVRDPILYTANKRKIYFDLSTECTNKSKELLLSVTYLGWEGRVLRQSCRSGIGSGSRKGLYSFEFLDQDPYSEYGSGSRCYYCALITKISVETSLKIIFFFSTADLVSSSNSLKLYQNQKGFEFFLAF